VVGLSLRVANLAAQQLGESALEESSSAHRQLMGPMLSTPSTHTIIVLSAKIIIALPILALLDARLLANSYVTVCPRSRLSPVYPGLSSLQLRDFVIS